MLIALLSTWKAALSPLLKNVNLITPEHYEEITGNPMYTPTPFSNFGGGSVVQPSPTNYIVVLEVQTSTPQPTAMASPTIQSTSTLPPISDVMTVGYSYYFPPLGPPNCADENWNGMQCRDTTASGVKWSDFINKGVAIPLSWLPYVGMGSIIRVLEPSELAGEWMVIDACGACGKENWADGIDRLDFLNDSQKLPWVFPVKIQFVRLVQP